ncbi:demethylmenaquinone methyltransferase [Alkalicoccus daliensis]|uniref:Demethylmenaquinone methyltransferase n=1 Tax=Alkalicoccus daliensis TaxID=745820 RepID=A0A1H0AVJ2_9BACI|nr:demethylmenaquinone methyltransferase [Alkalicoccus daliensis]SDN37508.1 demethylmenaquinone methyltransferase / 2-methoxy-6-polyprenyl-1,4-benzoquinol methylase [Alkalicoccus daliensis]
MNQSKEKRVHEVFESISTRYDRMNAIISFQLHVSWRKDTMKRMKVKKGAAALDLCCGTADWTRQLAEAAGAEGEVKGLDFSKNMLQIGEEKTADLPQVELIHGNAMELPFEDNYFDYVTIGFGLRNVPDYLTVLKEMKRVVKNDGLVVCLETSQPTLPVFKQFYWLYFTYVMPVFGKLFAGSYEQYSWLQESTKEFPDKVKLKQLFLEAGFKTVEIKSYSAGAAASHFASKEEGRKLI